MNILTYPAQQHSVTWPFGQRKKNSGEANSAKMMFIIKRGGKRNVKEGTKTDANCLLENDKCPCSFFSMKTMGIEKGHKTNPSIQRY